MSMFNRLLDQLKQRGLHVEPGKLPGQLLLCGPDREKTSEIVNAVKAFKPQLLEHLGLKVQPRAETCSLCSRSVMPEDKPHLQDCAICDRSQCPYKGKRS